MDTRWFQDFVTLADVRNFTHAAEIRNVSQAAFSRRIQALEHWLGAKLIDRTAFPTHLTSAGEQFRLVAIDLLNRIADAKAEIGEVPSRNHVRVAIPYSLATTRLPEWWSAWVTDTCMSCSIEVGNVHDILTLMSAGLADLLICFHPTTHPNHLDETRFERHEIGIETIRPFASLELVDSGKIVMPGTTLQPIPLLMYSPNAYFARLVNTAIKNAPQTLFGFKAFEVEMSDVLKDLATRGFGVAWLSDSTFKHGQSDNLIAVGNGEWDIKVSIVAYRAKSNIRRAVAHIWQKILETHEQ
ncbi:MAG: LysR family transcriptional regulator [Pseudomonadota bacterium]